jgi:hypothetical protein
VLFPLHGRRAVRRACVVFGLAFSLFFSAPPGLSGQTPAADRADDAPAVAGNRESWMNVFQGDRKIGFAHTVFRTVEDGYHLAETASLRINTLGVEQDFEVRTEAGLRRDFRLRSIRFEMISGRFRFAVEGTVTGDTLHLNLSIGGQARAAEIPLSDDPFILSGVMDAIRSEGMAPGDIRTYSVFNPAAMSMDSVELEHLGRETIEVSGETYDAVKVAVRFSGMEQFVWIDKNGDVLRESGILGIRMDRTSRADALFGLPVESSDDLTRVAAVPSDRTFDRPEAIRRLVVRITGVELDPAEVGGGRQSLSGDVLTIRKESLEGLPADGDRGDGGLAAFLAPSPFIQSDHPKIRERAAAIVGDSDGSLEKARKIIGWIYDAIEKRPVLSMPDAISTLENRVGDCNEHAMLLAALARAAGVPARVASGLVYQDGRFYYHAWNLLHVGEWVTADAAFGQFPADATHIRFALGEVGEQMDMMGMIGKIGVEVVEAVSAGGD